MSAIIPSTEVVFNMAPVAHPNNGAVLILCAILLLLTILSVAFRNKLSLVIRALFSQRYYTQLLREGRNLNGRMLFFTVIFDLMTFAFGVLVCVEAWAPKITETFTYMGTYGIAFVALLLMYTFKSWVNRAYTYLFDHHREYGDLHLYKFIFITSAAILLFPFLIVAQFSSKMVILVAYLPVFAVDFSLYFYKLMKINPRKINLFHFFIYFCTLEILPYLLLGKMVLSY